VFAAHLETFLSVLVRLSLVYAGKTYLVHGRLCFQVNPEKVRVRRGVNSKNFSKDRKSEVSRKRRVYENVAPSAGENGISVRGVQRGFLSPTDVIQGQFQPAGNSNFIEYPKQIITDGVLTQIELLGDIPIG